MVIDEDNLATTIATKEQDTPSVGQGPTPPTASKAFSANPIVTQGLTAWFC